MIDTTRIFSLDDGISSLSNELYKTRIKLSELLAENNNFYNRKEIHSLIAKRDLLNRQISNLQEKRKQLLEC